MAWLFIKFAATAEFVVYIESTSDKSDCADGSTGEFQ
jgi:hypothetical protein